MAHCPALAACTGAASTPFLEVLPYRPASLCCVQEGTPARQRQCCAAGCPRPKRSASGCTTCWRSRWAQTSCCCGESVLTQLSSVTNSSAYDLRFSLQGGSRSSQVSCLHAALQQASHEKDNIKQHGTSPILPWRSLMIDRVCTSLFLQVGVVQCSGLRAGGVSS